MAFHVRARGIEPVAYTFAPDTGVQLEEVRLHLSAAGGAGDFTVTLQSHAGDEYNLVLNTQDMASATDEHYQPTRPVFVGDGDSILCEWANANDKTWGLEIVYR